MFCSKVLLGFSSKLEKFDLTRRVYPCYLEKGILQVGIFLEEK